MTDLIPKPTGVKVGGLSRKAQKLQALRDKAANAGSGTKASPIAQDSNVKTRANSAGNRKTSFQRKAV